VKFTTGLKEPQRHYGGYIGKVELGKQEMHTKFWVDYLT
jgi:hypothetical protein